MSGGYVEARGLGMLAVASVLPGLLGLFELVRGSMRRARDLGVAPILGLLLGPMVLVNRFVLARQKVPPPSA